MFKVSNAFRFSFVFLTVLFLGGGPFAQDSLRAQGTLDKIVAVVDDDVIMASELAGSVIEVEREMRRSSVPVPDKGILVQQTLENLINERVLLHEAQQRGVVVTEQEVDQAVSQVAARNKIDLDKLVELLEQDGQSYKGYRESLRSRLLVQKLVDGEIGRQVQISDDEIEMAVAQQAREGGSDENVEYELFRILISAPEDIDQLQLQMVQGQAENVADRLSGGESFESVAEQFSDGPEAGAGGNLGWRKASELPALYLQALSSMQPGETSEVIRGPNGFHILKLQQTRGGRSTVIDEYRLRQILIRGDSVLSAEEVIKRIESIRERIVQGEDFGELARAHSEDARTQANGGDMGWVSTAGMPTEMARAVVELTPGEVSRPVRTQFGFHLFELTDKRQQDASELVEVDSARRKVMRRKSEELYNRWAAELRAKAYVEIRLDQL